MEKEDLIHYLIHLLDQYCYTSFETEENEILKTRWNCDARAVWALKEEGYVEILDGEWPDTKFIIFRWTEKAEEILRT